ncbi:MAG TPA: hypothetical protein PKY64_02050 [Anaerolineaceae bacterium]|nr:hypothetical protein [Anaerolineaceae bacterium]
MPIAKAEEFPIAIFPHPAETLLPWADHASVRTELATNLAVLQWGYQQRGVVCHHNLQDKKTWSAKADQVSCVLGSKLFKPTG